MKFLGVTSEASFGCESSQGVTYEIEEVHTTFIDPTDEYLKKSISSPSVAKYIADHTSKKWVYMITGARIAKGATVAKSRFDEIKGKVKAGIDGQPGGVPVSGGP